MLRTLEATYACILALTLILALHALGTIQRKIFRILLHAKGPLIEEEETEGPYLSYLFVSTSRIYFQVSRIYPI